MMLIIIYIIRRVSRDPVEITNNETDPIPLFFSTLHRWSSRAGSLCRRCNRIVTMYLACRKE